MRLLESIFSSKERDCSSDLIVIVHFYGTLYFIEFSSNAHSCLASFNKYLLSAYSMPGTALGPEDTAVKKTKKHEQ